MIDRTDGFCSASQISLVLVSIKFRTNGSLLRRWPGLGGRVPDLWHTLLSS